MSRWSLLLRRRDAREGREVVDVHVFGVKCLTDLGWYGEKRPQKFSKDEAEELAARLNADPDGDDPTE